MTLDNSKFNWLELEVCAQSPREDDICQDSQNSLQRAPLKLTLRRFGRCTCTSEIYAPLAPILYNLMHLAILGSGLIAED